MIFPQKTVTYYNNFIVYWIFEKTKEKMIILIWAVLIQLLSGNNEYLLRKHPDSKNGKYLIILIFVLTTLFPDMAIQGGY